MSTSNSDSEQYLKRRIASSVRKQESRLRLIYKDIASLENERDSLELKLWSVNERISKKRKEVQRKTENIAARKVIIGNTVIAQPAIKKSELEMKSQEILSPQLKERVSRLLSKPIPDPGYMMEEKCAETTYWVNDPLNDPMFQWFGYGANLDVANREPLMSECLEDILKNQELNGGTDICFSPNALSTTSDPTALISTICLDGLTDTNAW